VPFFPESLFLLSDRDRQVTWLDPLITSPESSQSLATFEVNYTVPEGRVLLLQSAHAVAVGGGAQTCSEIGLAVRTTSLGTYTYLNSDFETAAGPDREVSWRGSVIVPERWLIIADAVFSAAAVANFLKLSIFGMLVPIGNIQRL
jgi:hypothetical protein